MGPGFATGQEHAGWEATFMIPLFLEAALLGLAGYAAGLCLTWLAYLHIRYQSRGWK